MVCGERRGKVVVEVCAGGGGVGLVTLSLALLAAAATLSSPVTLFFLLTFGMAKEVEKVKVHPEIRPKIKI